MFIGHFFTAYIQGEMPLYLGLEGKDDFNSCEGDLPCDHKTLYFYNIHMAMVFVWGQISIVYFGYPLYIRRFVLLNVGNPLLKFVALPLILTRERL